MTAQLNPYLNFRGTAREAMAFYAEVFDAKVTISTFAEYQGTGDPNEADWVMHADLESPSGIHFYAADVPSHIDFEPGANVAMSLTGTSADDADLRGYFERLSAGARVDQPLETSPWGAVFGMLTDRYGIRWMVNIAGEPLG